MKILILIIGLGVLWSGCSQNCSNKSIGRYFPDNNEVVGWVANDTVRTFVGQDLFKLINGGAELYHENGFVQIVTLTFGNSTNQEISIEIYEMGTPDGATDSYMSKISPAGKKVEIGDEALLNSYYLNFRQGKYIVTLVGYSDDTETISGLNGLAKVISTNID